MEAKKSKGMTPERRKYLRDRLARVNNLHGTFTGYRAARKDSLLPVPAAVTAAEKEIIRLNKIIEQFRERQKAHLDGIARAKRRMNEEIHRVIEFEADPEKALALLDKFEAAKF